eukprot:GHUV01036425.1.p1 GENE.GHUV01036425.1~~GHUV01036425.1.p1  ORF type:complete len:176 (+),score=45.12 GHUV01036425.1:211-738(+)
MSSTLQASDCQSDGQKEQPWYCLESSCIHCAKGDFTEGYGPRTIFECSCCGARGIHVECFEQKTGKVMTEDMLNSGSTWFCGQECEEVSNYLESNIGVRVPVRGEAAEYTLEVVKYDKDSRGKSSSLYYTTTVQVEKQQQEAAEDTFLSVQEFCWYTLHTVVHSNPQQRFNQASG